MAKTCPVLFNIAEVTILRHSYQLRYCEKHSNMVQYSKIFPNIVKCWLMLSSTDQYCLVAACLDVFPSKLKPDSLQAWFRCSKQLAICNYASSQFYKVCKYAIKVQVRLPFSHLLNRASKNFFYKSFPIWCAIGEYLIKSKSFASI